MRDIELLTAYVKHPLASTVLVINYKYKEFGQSNNKAYDGKYYFFRLNEMDAGNYETHTQKYK